MTTQSWKSGGIGEVVQANRLPLALIGVGVAWLAANNAGLTDRFAHDERAQAARRRIGESANNLGIGGTSASGDNAALTGHLFGPDGEPLARAEGNRSAGWIHHAAGAARGAIGSMREAGIATLDRAGDYAGNAGDLARRAGGQVAERIHRDPWLVGVMGLVAGALLAAMLPPTRSEQQRISNARDELWKRATEFGHDAAGRVRELADSTIRASRQW
jgi:hypothetical protein